VITQVDKAAREFRKQSETPEEANRLRAEAEVLNGARHPGVVQLLGMEGDCLRLRLVDGDRLGEASVDEPEMARLAAAAATTLADLHEIGVVHRAIRPEHVLVTSAGQPILCGFGRAAAGPEVGATDRADDVAALAKTLLAGSATATVDEVRRRILTDAARPGSRGPTARQLATLLTATTPAPPSRRRGDPGAARDVFVIRAGTALGALAAVALLAVLILVVPPLVDSANPRPDAAHAAACPVIDRGCRPLPRPDGVVQTPEGRYRIGQAGDLVVIGRWQCGGALPALLQPGSGDVWVWDSWAAGAAPVAARLAARVPHARSVQVDPGRSGCDRLQVIVPGGRAVVVQPA
jgi:serine/threonine protein kinase